MTLRPAFPFRPAFRLKALRAAAVLATAFALSACTGQDTASTPAAPAATPAAPAATTAPAAATPADAGATPAATPGPIVPPTGPAPVAGTDYVEIPGGQPFEPGTGRIEVVEVFGYTCPACARFEPQVAAWKAKLPADVKFTPVAAPFGGHWMPYAKAFYAAQTMGLLDRTHDAMFRAIHIERSLPVQPLPTDEQLAQFYAKYGADPQQFTSTMASFATDAKLKRATQWLQRSGADSTPTLIVNGKYRVTGGQTHADQLRITEHLIARERGGNAAPAPADSATAPAAPAGG